MKKFLDSFVLKSIWRQLLLAVFAGFIIVALAVPVARFFLDPQSMYTYFHSSWIWSLLHLCDGGSIAATISVAHASPDQTAGNVAMVSAFIVWFAGTILFCFITGAISNAFEVRKNKVESGLVRYHFSGKHGVVIGWDFQGVAIIAALKELFHCREIVILTSQSAVDIRRNLESELSAKEMKTVFIHRGNVFSKNDLYSLAPFRADFVVILGDQNEENNDSGNRRILTLLPESEFKVNHKVPCFIDIENPYSLWQEEFSIHSRHSQTYFPHVLNFYKHSVNELLGSLFSIYSFDKGRREGVYEYEYSPLAFRRNPEADHIHLIVSGFDKMAHMFIVQAIRVLQPSKSPHRITVFSDSVDEVKKFRDFYSFELLQNIQIEFFTGSVCSSENREKIAAAVKDISASVTLLIADPSPNEAMEEFYRLPAELSFENVHIVIEQQIMSRNCRGVYSLRRRGYSDVNYVGLLDKFYYSLLKQDQFVDIFEQEHSSNSQMIMHRLRDDRRRFIDTLPEKLSAQDLVFDMMIREKNAQVPLQQADACIESLAEAEHRNFYNNCILNGVRYAEISHDRYFLSNLLKPWHELSEEQKETFRNKARSIVPAVNRMFNQSGKTENGYAVFERKFRRVCGFVDNSELRLNWYDGDYANRIYQNMAKYFQGFRNSTRYSDGIFKKSKKCHRYPSFALLCTLEENNSEMMVAIANREHVPVIAVLPEAPEKYQYSFAEGYSRNEFWKRLRNVYTYFVVPEEVKDKKEYMDQFIMQYSDEVWHTGKVAFADNSVAISVPGIRYISRKKEKPVFREVTAEGTLVPERQKKVENDLYFSLFGIKIFRR